MDSPNLGVPARSGWGSRLDDRLLSLQPSIAPSRGSMGASRGRTPSSSLAARGWWMGMERGGGWVWNGGVVEGIRDPWGAHGPWNHGVPQFIEGSQGV